MLIKPKIELESYTQIKFVVYFIQVQPFIYGCDDGNYVKMLSASVHFLARKYGKPDVTISRPEQKIMNILLD